MEKVSNDNFAIIDIADGILIFFIGTAENQVCTSSSIEGMKSIRLGLLNSINRNKALAQHPSFKTVDRKDLFTKALKNRKWNFDKFPNPTAFLAISKELLKKTSLQISILTSAKSKDDKLCA